MMEAQSFYFGLMSIILMDMSLLMVKPLKITDHLGLTIDGLNDLDLPLLKKTFLNSL